MVHLCLSLLEQLATIFFVYNSSIQQVGDILGLLVQDGLGGPVTLNGLEPLGCLHLPGNDEGPCLHGQPLPCWMRQLQIYRPVMHLMAATP